MKTKVVILGAAGRMGKTLIRCILEEKVPGLELHGAVDGLRHRAQVFRFGWLRAAPRCQDGQQGTANRGTGGALPSGV